MCGQGVLFVCCCEFTLPLKGFEGLHAFVVL